MTRSAAPQADGAGTVPKVYTSAGQVWAGSFERYLTRAAGQTARSVALALELTAAAGRGDIAPADVEQKLEAFLDAGASSYAMKLSELAVRFLGALVESGAECARELVEAIVPEVSVPAGDEAPRFDPAGWPHWFEELTEYAGRQGAEAARGYRSVLDRVASGTLLPARVAEAASSFAEERLPRELGRVVDLCFDLLNDLDELRAGYGEEFLAGVLGSVPSPAGDAAPGLDLTAPLGSAASARLSVTNTAAEVAVIRPAVTDLRRSDGVGPAFLPDVVIVPEEFELGPGQGRDVTVTIVLGEDAYAAGPVYAGALRVVGDGEALLELPLRITATAATGGGRTSGEGPT